MLFVEQAHNNKLVIVTDTYEQVNGVSTTYKNLEKIAEKRGLDLKIVHPGLYRWIPMPFYPEIQLSVQPIRLWITLNKLKPERIHVATEGAMGFVARRWCKWHKKAFTTSYHTKFPEYLKVILGIPEKYAYWYLRRFHSAAKATFVTTQSIKDELTAQGFNNLVVWTRGVADNLISANLPSKHHEKLRVLNVGRVSKEKNLDVLCAYENDFNITIVGDGPYLETLKSKYKKVNFLGYKFGEELADIYAAHDIFAFPSVTDTFGIVIIEAMSNGLPVAGYNVAGPKDVIEHGVTGIISDDLYQSIIDCKKLNREKIKQNAKQKWSWDNCFDIFIRHLQS
jgi:glycosyltransferase involved in cell wall biosynthesis